MDVILVTRNESKAEQIKAIFSGSAIRIRTLSEAGIKGDAVEDGNSLSENALKKARFVQAQTGSKVWTIADDTGLFIDALGGAPGVHSKRWAGPDSSTERIMQYTLAALRGISNRGAMFETVVAVLPPDKSGHFFSGSIRGTILKAPRCPCQPQMPYSAIFLPDGHTQTWAEMTVEEENIISHRGQAFRKAKLFLENMKRLS